MNLKCLLLGHIWEMESKILDGGLYRCKRCRKLVSNVPSYHYHKRS